MAIDNAAIAGLVASNGQWIANSATTLFQTQCESAANMAKNEKELAEYEKIKNSKKYSFVQKGSTVVLEEQEKDTSPFLAIIEGGMEAPPAGGSNGTVTNPDGSTYQSQVPPSLWGTPLPEYAKDPNPISEGVQIMLQTLVPQWVRDTVASSKGDIATICRNEVISRLQL